MRIVYNPRRYGMEYLKKSEEDYAEQQRAKQEKNLHRRAKELGYELKKIAPPELEPVLAT